MARPREFNEEDVVDKATEIFWAKGYRSTTPRDLLEATGLSKSSLYNTFGSKQGLFLRSLDQYVDQNEAVMAEMLDMPLRAALEGMYGKVVHMSASEEQGGMGMSCMMCTASIEVHPSETVLYERVRQARERTIGVFHRRLERAVADGEIASDADPLALARFLFAANMGLVVLGRSGASVELLKDAADQVIRHLFP